MPGLFLWEIPWGEGFMGEVPPSELAAWVMLGLKVERLLDLGLDVAQARLNLVGEA